MNDRLEHDDYKPINISHLYYFVLLASYICGSTAFSKFILIKMPDTLIFIVTLPNLIDIPMECYVLVIYTIALAGLYLALVDNLLNFYSNSTVS